jgi:hypothetical protein
MEPVIKNEIRLDLVCRLIRENWKRFLMVMSATAVVTYLIVLGIPRYYVVDVVLAPEYGEQSSPGNSSLSAAASMFGVNIGNSGGDAIVPEFYPQIVKSTDFLVPLMETEVVSQDGEFRGTYGEYILKREKSPWWKQLYSKIKRIFVSESEPESYKPSSDYKIDPFKLTAAETKLLGRVSESIGCAVSEKSGVITLSVKSQDPLVAATMANKVKDQLQDFMTKYRTEKNKEELIERSKATLEERSQDLEVKKNELDEIVAETKAEEEKLREKAKNLEISIEPRLLTAFKRIRKNSRNGLGIVYVQRDACGGCFAKIPPQRQLDVRMRKKVIVCEYCGRILIDPELAGVKAEVKEEKPKRRRSIRKKDEEGEEA